jgi:flagellar basal body-associated protein FliL
MNTTTDSEKTTEKFSTISLDSSSKNTVRVLLNIVIIIILMALIIYAIVGTYIFYHKYVRDGAAPVVEAAASVTETASAAVTETAAEIKKMLGGFVNNVRF